MPVVFGKRYSNTSPQQGWRNLSSRIMNSNWLELLGDMYHDAISAFRATSERKRLSHDDDTYEEEQNVPTRTLLRNRAAQLQIFRHQINIRQNSFWSLSIANKAFQPNGCVSTTFRPAHSLLRTTLFSSKCLDHTFGLVPPAHHHQGQILLSIFSLASCSTMLPSRHFLQTTIPCRGQAISLSVVMNSHRVSTELCLLQTLQ